MNFSSHRHFKVCWDALTCLLYDISCLLRFAVLCAEDWNALNCVLYIVFYIFLRPVHCFAMLRGVLRAVRSCPVFEFYVLNHNASHYVNFSWILLNERILSCQACALCHDFKWMLQLHNAIARFLFKVVFYFPFLIIFRAGGVWKVIDSHFFPKITLKQILFRIYVVKFSGETCIRLSLYH